VSSPILLGRDDDLAVVDRVLDDAAGGQARLLLVGGEAGIGKSRLLAEVVARAAGPATRSAGGGRVSAGAAEFTVLAGSCVDLGEGAPAFSPFADAVRSFRRSAGDAAIEDALGAGFAELGPLVPGSPVVGERMTQPAPGRVFEAVVELLEGLAETAPVLLTIEDAHWADQSTRDLLAFLSRTLTDARVAIVVTYRTDELHRRHPLRSLLAELERLPRTVRLDLRPLTRREVVQQLVAIQGQPLDADLVESIWERGEGNPFYAEELLIAEETCERLPTSVREGTLTRVNALPERHQSVLRVAAAVGREVDDELLTELTGLPSDEFAAIMRDLLGDSLLVLEGDGYRFRHALLQEVVYDELLPGERVRLHVKVAEHLVARQAPGDEGASRAAELAHHWFQARRAPEALAASVAAGLAAEDIGAPADALSHYERALELWDAVPDADARSGLSMLDLLERTAVTASTVGRFERAIATGRNAVALAEAGGDMARAGILHQRLGRDLFVADLPGAIEEFERGVELVPAEPVTAARAGVLAGYAQVLMLTGRLGEARTNALAALSAALSVGARRVEGHARNTLGTVLSNLGEPHALEELEAALDIALEVRDAEDIGRAYVNLTHVLSEAGRWEELVTRGAEAVAGTRRLGIDRTHGVYVETNLMEGLLALGRWDDAAAVQRSLTERLPRGHWEYFAITALDADRGDFDALRAAVSRAGRLPEHDTAVLQGLGAAFEGQVALAVWERRPEDARPLTEELLARTPLAMRGWKVAPVLWRALWAEADLAQLARARRDEAGVDDARRAADRWLQVLAEVGALQDDRSPDRRSEGEGGEARDPELDGRVVRPVVGADVYGALAQAERRRLDGDDTAADWLAAAARFDELRITFPAAYARFRAGEAHLRAGDRAAADEAVQQARTVAKRLGARPLLALLDQLASRGRLVARPATAGPTGADEEPEAHGLGLSVREREVLVLVAEGRTNREIAEALYISPKTASVHVSNILAKLGVSGRVEAAAVAQRVGLAG
jgi:DNA-binding CsgD family transcriptional regulator